MLKRKSSFYKLNNKNDVFSPRNESSIKALKGDKKRMRNESIIPLVQKISLTPQQIFQEEQEKSKENAERLYQRQMLLQQKLREQEERQRKLEEQRKIEEEQRRKEEAQRLIEEEKLRKQREEEARIRKQKEDEERERQRKLNLKYHYIKYNKPIIILPEGEGTDDKDQFTLVNLMNMDCTKQNGFEACVNEKDKKVYKKHTEGNPVILIKSICTIPYKKDVIFEAISNLKIRRQWDTVFSELKVIENEGMECGEILYMIIKAPAIAKDRDFIQRKKVWRNFPNENSIMMHFVSVNHDKYPAFKKYVRAETIISGYFIKDNGNGTSLLGIISQTDIKGSVPTWLVNKFAPSSSKNWINSLLKGCQIVQKNKPT